MAFVFWRLLFSLTYGLESLGFAMAKVVGAFVLALFGVLTWPFKAILWSLAFMHHSLKTASLAYQKKRLHIQKAIIAKRQAVQHDWQLRSAHNKRQISHRLQHLANLRVKPQKQSLKPALAFAVFLFLVLAPFATYRHFNILLSLKTKITRAAGMAVSKLYTAKEAAVNKDLNAASADFQSASADFIQAETEIAKINSTLLKLTAVLPDSDLKLAASAKALAGAGRLGTAMAAELATAVNALLGPDDLTIRLTTFNQSAIVAAEHAHSLRVVLAEVKLQDLPPAYQAEFSELKKAADILDTSLTEIVDLVDNIKIFAGAEQDKRYLLIFQNNSEMRASGGFMGSFAILDLSQGKIKKIETPAGGTYDTEAGHRFRLAAPDPLWLVGSKWSFWDANWWPDWRQTGKKLAWFYENSMGSSVDGVIAFTPDVIINLLKIVGPVELPEYRATISAENFRDTVQFITEQETGATTSTPKKIIGDLSNQLITKLSQNLDRQRLTALLGMLEKSLDEKQMLLYFKEDKLQTKIASLGWDGAIKETDQDYLMVVNTNIAGAKSDRRMLETIEHRAVIEADGSITDTVIITREHTGVRGELFSGVRNVDWLRVYVPLGAKLIKAEGYTIPEKRYFNKRAAKLDDDPDLANEHYAATEPVTGTKIYREQNKTVFANWLMVDPGERRQIKLVYKLPFTLQASPADTERLPGEALFRYTLLMQKQPGAIHTAYRSAVSLEEAQAKIVWQSPETSSTPIDLAKDKLNAYIITR
jgi:hypothetical protein